MKKKKIPQKFIKKAKVIEVAKGQGLFTRLVSVRLPSARLFPEKELIVGFMCGCLVVGIAFSTLRLTEAMQAYEVVQSERRQLLTQKMYWQGVVQKYPSYRDARFRLGVLAYQEGDNNQAREEIYKALEIDPSFTEARLFLERIKE